MDENHFYRVNELAEKLNMTTTAIYKFIRTKNIKRYYSPNYSGVFIDIREYKKEIDRKWERTPSKTGFYTIKQASKILGVTIQYIYNKIYNGTIPFRRRKSGYEIPKAGIDILSEKIQDTLKLNKIKK